MDESERLIDAAINSYPLASLPPGFTQRLMKRINPSKPALRLSMLDWLLPGFFSLFGLGSVAAVWLTVPLLDPLWVPRIKLTYQIVMLRLALISTWQPVLLPVLALAIVGGLVGFALIYGAIHLSSNRINPQRSSTNGFSLPRH
jgi:hypothetical protein